MSFCVCAISPQQVSDERIGNVALDPEKFHDCAVIDLDDSGIGKRNRIVQPGSRAQDRGMTALFNSDPEFP